MTMDLRDIEYFSVVAQHRHLGRAAAALDAFNAEGTDQAEASDMVN